jgi:beta-galactosidase/beta-glucuronidase
MVHAEFSLAAPMLWDPEHPNLHALQVSLDGGMHVVAIRLGIRELVIVGSQMLLNGRSIKGRGTTHETHRFFGR